MKKRKFKKGDHVICIQDDFYSRKGDRGVVLLISGDSLEKEHPTKMCVEKGTFFVKTENLRSFAGWTTKDAYIAQEDLYEIDKGFYIEKTIAEVLDEV